jgi:hypothetical protein
MFRKSLLWVVLIIALAAAVWFHRSERKPIVEDKTVNRVGLGTSAPMTPEERNKRMVACEHAFAVASTPFEKQMAIAQMRSLAESGEPRAQNWMGRLYEKGEGVPKDEHEALRWYSLAKQQGFGNGGDTYNLLDRFHALTNVWPDGVTRFLIGRIETERKLVLFRIRRDAQVITGTGYFMPFEQELMVQGTIDPHGQFEWRLMNNSGQSVGEVRGVLGGTSPVNLGHQVWSEPGKTESTPFVLHDMKESEYETYKQLSPGAG